MPQENQDLARKIEAASAYFTPTTASRFESECPDYVYAPDDIDEMLTLDHLRNVLLSLALHRVDFAVVSFDLAELPQLKISSPLNNTIFSFDMFQEIDAGRPLPAGAKGRVMRLLPAPPAATLKATSTLTDLDFGELKGGQGQLYRPASHPRPGVRPTERPPQLLPLASHSPGNRKTVFILPIFMSVGGAERNLIEIMKPLADRYSFVVIVTERLSEENGSLNYQVLEHCDAIYDLGELAPSEDHFAMIDALSSSYNPRLLFIGNGSPWLANNLPALRDRFRDIPIVDHQSYDANNGWIQQYGRPGFADMDRYIAINSHIQRVFRERFNIPEAKIDLIHHAIDASRFNLRRGVATDRAKVARELGLSLDGRIIAMIARLTEQKRPLDYLALAQRSQSSHPEILFLLVGDGELADDCDRFIRNHDLTNVRRIPFIEDVSQLHPILDGLVFCSLFEGLPVAMLEALAMGVPILSSEAGDIPFVLEEYGTGRIFRPAGNINALYDAFSQWYADLEALQGRARKMAPLVEERFMASYVADQYDASWTRAIRERGAAELGGLTRGRPHTPLVPISVIIPTHNREDLLVDALAACVRMAGDIELEFVVIDDGSVDGTAKRLSELSRQMPNLVWRSIPNGGPGQARNLGASIAKHDVILFMGDDIQPVNENFFRIHAEIHAKYSGPNLAVLGKIVWPSDPDASINFVMAHIQGRGGEQFGFADLPPYSFLDWRFFYTAQVSVKKSIVDDWIHEGFDSAFTLAAYEDGEFAYRMSQRKEPLRLYYTAAAIGSHHHQYSLNDFMNRQLSAGRMAKVFHDLHPEAATTLGVDEFIRALSTPVTPSDDQRIADYLSIIEGIKSWARLIENDRNLGSEYWHKDLLHGLFELCFTQGFILSWPKPEANFASAYRDAIDRFIARTKYAANVELSGSVLDRQFRDFGGLTAAPAAPPGSPQPMTPLRRWASGRPMIVRLYRSLKRILHAIR